MWRILAAFFDINDNGYDIGDAGALLMFIIAISGVLWAIAKFFLLPQIRRMVVEEVDRATAPIQEHANGGYSLPDVARKGNWTGEAVKVIADHFGIRLPDDETLAKDDPRNKQ